MAELAWGIKRTCTGCGARFYDLRKTPPTCPKCGVALESQTPVRGKRARGGAKEATLPVDDFDLELNDNLDVGVTDDDPTTLLEDEEAIEQGLGVNSDSDDDAI